MERTPIALSLCLAVLAGWTTAVNAAYLIEVDADGADDGVLTFNSNFSFGGDTTTASQSIASTAIGLTGADSIFGGDGVIDVDTYLYTYTPGADVDNLNLPAGNPLNNDGDIAFGLPGGVSGTYRIYATWPFTDSVSGGDTTYALSSGGSDLFSVAIDQNNKGHEWVYVGEADLTAGVTYTLTQTSGTNTFVSMRSSAVMFERVPEPTSIALTAGVGVVLLGVRRRLR
jgi:hypothetical protein